MPQEVQIVPKYLHSHVETYVNDYTQFDDEAAAPVDNNSKFITVFKSSKGIDNTIIKKTDYADFIRTYGRSNYQKYGQPLMMPLAMLQSGSASCYTMRVMPDNAFAANSILVMLYRFDEEAGKMYIKYRASYIDKSAFSSTDSYKTHKAFKRSLKNYAATLKTTQPDSEGFYQIPVATFRMAGRGVYGNDYRWRIARNVEYEMDYGIKMYSFEALSTTNGLEKVATFVGSVVTSNKFNSVTLINDVLDAQEVGAAVMDVQVFEDEIEDLYNQYVDFVGKLEEDTQDEIPDLDCWDIFFGLGVDSEVANKNMEIIPESMGTDDISIDRAQGISMNGGSEGDFDPENPVDDEGTPLDPRQVIDTATTNAYIAAFTGELDRMILSSRRIPCDAILDANYPFEVKQAMADLVNTREDCLLYLDAGTETTLAQVDNIIEEYSIFNTRNISKEFQHYEVRDFSTKKKVDVTTTFFFAQRLATHYRQNGYHVPFVKGNSTLTGHVANSLEPVIDDVDLDIKEKLYKNRINYFECIEENVYQRCSQNTAQMINSDLMEENNMNTLFHIKKILETDCFERLYNFTNADDRSRFTEFEMAKFASWRGRQLDTIDISFDVNEWEAERSIVHCYVAVQFRNLMKRVIVEIDVNKRNFLG